MADITMCVNKDCIIRNKCFRAQAKPKEYQSYSDFQEGCNEESGYIYMIDMTKRYKEGGNKINVNRAKSRKIL